MKKLFFLGILFLTLFEIANVYFIMPLPGSQVMKSIDLAYFLHSFRWVFRGVLGFFIVVGLSSAWSRYKWITMFLILVAAGIIYMTHFEMAADTMFYQPKYVQLNHADNNVVPVERIILGVEFNGQAKAYPIQFLGYHHQVQDSIGGKPIMVTYCTVCRTGRVFEPIVNGKKETFRLVGMDHFNAMFEDKSTRSWWRQETGVAVSGPLKGQALPEIPSVQTSLATWLQLHPNTLVMQPDSNFKEIYAELSDYESGKREGKLTRRDTASWKDKSWIAGIVIGERSRAYDWNELVHKGVINDTLSTQPVSIIVTNDQKSFFAFIRNSSAQQLSLRHDTLTDGVNDFTLSGLSQDTISADLKPIQVYQEYWHSWRTFHPETGKY